MESVCYFMQYLGPQDDIQCELPWWANREQTRHIGAEKGRRQEKKNTHASFNWSTETLCKRHESQVYTTLGSRESSLLNKQYSASQ